MRKKLLSALLSLVLLLALVPTVAYASTDEMTADANALYQLGLFNGTGKDSEGNPIFDLDRTPTRYEAVTMLVRLLGRASEAESKEWNTPFTDVSAWAKPYVGYAYENKLTSGTSGTTYGGVGNATVTQYLTFVLRALGYDSSTDFEWKKAWELSDKIGLTNGQYNASTTNFTRGDVVIISYNALSCNLKGKDTTLIDDLTARGVVKEHTHNYIEKTVPGTGGHYEQVQVGTEKVIVGYESRVRTVCPVCGFETYDTNEFREHTMNVHDACQVCYTEKTPIYEEQPKYETVWVEDSPTTIRVCSICGQQEP